VTPLPRRDADRELFRDAGLAILLDETVVQHEPEGDLPFHWMLARKSDALAFRPLVKAT